MTTVTPPHWGERSYLYDKSLDYVFSLEIVYKLVTDPKFTTPPNRIPLHAEPPDVNQVSTFRVLPADQFDSLENVKRDVPRGRVSSARDWLTLTEEGAVPLDGRVLIDTEAPEPIAMAYTGVLNLSGGTAQLARVNQEVKGTAFIASQQEVSNPRYKWLVYNQLIGIGRAVATPPLVLGSGRWHLRLRFDLYLGS